MDQTTTTIKVQDKQALDPFMQAGEKALAEVEAVIITNKEESDELYRKDRNEWGGVLKQIKTVREIILQPMKAYQLIVDIHAKKAAAPMEKARLIAKGKLLDFREEKEREEKEREGWVNNICSKISTCDSLEMINEAMETMAEEDKNDPKIQLAYHDRKTTLETIAQRKKDDEIRKAEAARLAEIAKTQSAERAKLEADKIKHEQEMRNLDKKQAEADAIIDADALRKKQAEVDKAAAKNKTLGGRTTWDYEVIDGNKVPRLFLTIDEKEVRAAIKDGEREIPGLKIFQKTT